MTRVRPATAGQVEIASGLGQDPSAAALSTDLLEEAAALEAAGQPNSVGSAVARGFSWNFLNFAVSQVASTVFFLLLARELPPAVFGVFAMALLVVEFVTNQGKSAAVDALLQRRTFDGPTLSGFFFALSGICLTLFALSWPLAQILSRSFHAADLRLVLPALALTIIFTPPLAIMEALVMKDLQFKTLALRNMTGTLVGGAAGLAIVFSPERSWALVVQRLAAVVITLLFLLLQTRWRPGKARFRETPALLGSTFEIWLSQALATSIGRVGDALIAARLGAGPLGVFRVAGRIVETLHGPITNPVMALWVPIMSGIQHNRDLGRRMYLNLCKISALICVPAFLGLGMIGKDVADVVLAPQYREAGPIMFWVSLIGLYIPVGYFRGPVFTALGRNRLAIAFCCLDIGLNAIVFAEFAPQGLLVLARATLIPMVISGVSSLAAILWVTRTPARDYAGAVFPAYVAAAAMAAVLLVTRRTLGGEPALIRLVFGIMISIVVYAGVLGIFFRSWLIGALGFIRSRRSP